MFASPPTQTYRRKSVRGRLGNKSGFMSHWTAPPLLIFQANTTLLWPLPVEKTRQRKLLILTTENIPIFILNSGEAPDHVILRLRSALALSRVRRSSYVV